MGLSAVVVCVDCVGVVLQTYDVAEDDVSVTLAPSQIVPSLFDSPEVSATVIIGIGSGSTVMVVDVVEEHPSEFVTVTVYVVVVTGDMVIAATDSPELHT
jgi:hypothetical protein